MFKNHLKYSDSADSAKDFPLEMCLIKNYTSRPKQNLEPEPIKETPKEPKKEQTKNVSFKNHLDYTSPPSSKAVPEKDQLAKLPYGWSTEVNLIEIVKNI